MTPVRGPAGVFHVEPKIGKRRFVGHTKARKHWILAFRLVTLHPSRVSHQAIDVALAVGRGSNCLLTASPSARFLAAIPRQPATSELPARQRGRIPSPLQSTYPNQSWTDSRGALRPSLARTPSWPCGARPGNGDVPSPRAVQLAPV